ncbi:MAG: small multi-drug export protein [Methanocorpusculum sp.]|nr:small multi-drug export protein [Methanocorpusculum sp.]
MTEEPHYYRPDRKIRFIMSFGILGVLAAVVFIIFLALPFDQFVTAIILLGIYMCPGFGKESIIPAMLGGGHILEALENIGIYIELSIPLNGFPLWIILLGIVAIDMTLAIIISYNFDLLLRVPLLGKVLGLFTDKMTVLLDKKPWIKGLASAGLFLFMFIPFMGSSAIDTSIIGRIISMHPKILLPIVFFGSVLATLVMAVGVNVVINLWMANPFLALAAIAGAIIIGVVIWKLWRKYITPRFAKKEN